MSEISDVFNPPAEEPVESQQELELEAEESQETEVEPEAPEKEEEPKEEEETTSSEYDQLPPWAKQRLKDDRQKAQEAKKQLEQMQKELESLKTPKTEEKQEVPDVFDDQAAFVNSIQSQFDQKLQAAVFNMSEELMRQHHEDYDEVIQFFVDKAKDYPALAEQGRKQQNPARWAYEQGKKFQELDRLNNIDSYKSELEAKIRKQVEEEFSQKQQEKQSKAENLSPSLTKQKSASVNDPVMDSLQSVFN